MVQIIDKDGEDILIITDKHITSIDKEENNFIIKTDVILEDIKEEFIKEVVEDTVNILLGAAEKVEQRESEYLK